jgi:hypothetical protein
MAGDRKPIPFMTTPFRELRGQFSPDGKWIAYTSDESGRDEVYVQSFPISGFKAQVSSKGGDWVRWRKDGKELFYVAPDRKLMTVAVGGVSSSLEVATPTALFALPVMLARGGDTTAPYTYDVMPDGQRFLALTPTKDAEKAPMTVILNWKAELFDCRSPPLCIWSRRCTVCGFQPVKGSTPFHTRPDTGKAQVILIPQFGHDAAPRQVAQLLGVRKQAGCASMSANSRCIQQRRVSVSLSVHQTLTTVSTSVEATLHEFLYPRSVELRAAAPA